MEKGRARYCREKVVKRVNERGKRGKGEKQCEREREGERRI